MNEKIFLLNDYSEGCCEEILKKLNETNLLKTKGYGEDEFCKSASEKIKKACNCPEAEIKFLIGGTQTNKVVLDVILKKYEGVISCESGHIAIHEAGAIENSGHKVLVIKGKNGKLDYNDVENYLKAFNSDETKEHMVFPGAIYISHPTEFGTLYTKEELINLYNVSKKYNLSLYVDGARLGYALACEKNEIDLPTLAQYSDVFCFGGTKVGTLFGEAVVFTKKNIPNHITSLIKMHGALLAKGRILGIQFDTLFTDNLYQKLGKNAIECAMILKNEMNKKGYKIYLDSYTNLQYFILNNKKIEELKNNAYFYIIEKYDENNSIIRLVTSWATKKEDILKFIELL